MAEVSVVREYPDDRWSDDGPTRGVEDVVESGHVLAFPRLPFVLEEGERRFLDPRWADPKAKNVSVRWPGGELRGAVGPADDLAALRRMIVRYAEQSEAFALRLFPHYRGQLRRGTPCGLTLQKTRRSRVPCIGFDGNASTCSRVSSWRQLRGGPVTSVGLNELLPRRSRPR